MRDDAPRLPYERPYSEQMRALAYVPFCDRYQPLEWLQFRLRGGYTTAVRYRYLSSIDTHSDEHAALRFSFPDRTAVLHGARLRSLLAAVAGERCEWIAETPEATPLPGEPGYERTYVTHLRLSWFNGKH